MAERREEVHQPQPVAALPIGRGEAGVRLQEARLGGFGEIGPGGDGDGAAFAILCVKLLLLILLVSQDLISYSWP
jgi:hypothetical protein